MVRHGTSGAALAITPERAAGIVRRAQELRAGASHTLLSRIGNTSLVELQKVNPHAPVRIFAKIEGQNPSGSMKDRSVLFLIADALERGLVTPKTVLVEASSGNTGISVAMIGAILGYRVLITIPANVSVERFKLLNSYGTEVVVTPGEQGTDGAIARAREICEKPGHYWLAQHYNAANSLAHYETTGPELIEQLRALGVTSLDAFVAGSGTTGTLMGVSARLKDSAMPAKVVAVWPRDRIMGLRRPEGERRPGIYDQRLIDEVVEVQDVEARKAASSLARSEGILTGPSGGAVVHAAIRLAARLAKNPGRGAVAVLIPDSGERYLSMTEGNLSMVKQ